MGSMTLLERFAIELIHSRFHLDTSDLNTHDLAIRAILTPFGMILPLLEG